MSTETRDALRAEDVARLFHEAYERLAPSFGYETRRDSAVPWDQVPEQNRRLMVAVAGEVVAALRATDVPVAEGLREAATEALRVLESVADEHRRHLRQGDLIGAKWINLAADGLRTALATPEPDA